MKILFVLHSSKMVYGAAKSIGYVLQNINYEYDVMCTNIMRVKCSSQKIKQFVGKNCSNIYHFNLPYESSIVSGLDFNNTNFKKILRKLGLRLQNILSIIDRHRIYKTMEKGHYDIIYLNSITLFPLINKKHCFVMHVREPYNGVLRKEFLRKLSYLSGIIYIDEAVKKSINYDDIPFNLVINNPSDMINIKNINKNEIMNNFNLVENDVVFSIIGTVIDCKGVEFVINCFMETPMKKIKLLVVGDNKSYFALKCMDEAKKDNRILFLGEILDIEKIYAVTDYVIRADLQFCIGRTIYEGLYSGCGVLIQGEEDDIMSLPEYEDYRNRIYCYKTRNAASFVKKIKELSQIKIEHRKYYSNVDNYIDRLQIFLIKIFNQQGGEHNAINR